MDVGEVPPDDLVHLRVPGQHLKGGVSGDGYRIEDVEPEARRAGLSAARIPAVLHWLRRASREPDTLRQAITSLKLIDGSQLPTEADVARFQAYADPGVGDPTTSWYALLRFTQGDPATILDCGYIVDEGDPHGWVYEVNCDDQSFSVDNGYADNAERLTWPWSALPSDHEFLDIERGLDPDSMW